MKARTKPAILIFAASILILFLSVCGFIFVNQAKFSLYDEKVNYLKEISLKSAENVKSNINGYISTIEAIAAFFGSNNDFDVNHALPILKAEADKNFFKRMGIILPDGTAITTDGQITEFNDREYFKKALKGQPNISDTLIDKADGYEINVIAVPIYNNAKIVGVVFATKTQEAFSQIMKMESFNGEGYSYIITSDGSPIVKTTHKNSLGDYKNIFDEMSAHGMNKDNLNRLREDIKFQKDGFIENIKDGEKRQLCYTKIGINNWYIISVVPSASISFQSDKLIIELIVLAISFLLITTIGSILIIITFQKKNKELIKIAYTDSVTGYANRAGFLIDAKNILDNNKNQSFAMVLFNISKFKVINDLFGHKTGNAVLKSIAGILNKITMSTETFSRITSDNFCVLLKFETEKAITDLIKKISEQIEHIINDYTIEISAGIYIITEPDLDINIISDRAAIACNIAKQQNDFFYCFFKEENRLEIINEKEIENIMESALKSNEFEMYLQPQYSLKTDEIIGAEALVRWNRKGMGLVYPKDFIPLFEKNGFIKKLDLYMFNKVCDLLAKWKNDPAFKLVPISVNLSRIHLSDLSLPQKLISIVNEYNLNPNLLEIELTESALYIDIENMIKMMTNIRETGILLSIDDFGSGYSSLSTLKNLPVDYLKIDKSFLDNSVDDKRGEDIICNIINMSSVLGILTIAEGVETSAQIDFLKKAGCNIAQGYFYSKPVQISEFEKLISNQE